jgi:uncharacterized protein
VIGRSPIGEGDRSDEGRGRTALVSGASSGIGRSMAELLAAKGYDVVPVARRRQRLDQLKAELEPRWRVSVDPMEADLGEPDGPSRVLALLGEQDRRIDFLVNNAGNSWVGRYETVPWEVHEERLRLMVLAAFRLSHGVLPGMVDRGWGRIVNMSSIAGLFTGFPTDITYNAIKGMLERFSEGIDGEYRELGIRSTVSMPGPTATEIFEGPNSSADVGDSMLFSKVQMTPQYVARKTYAAVMRGKPMIAPGPHNAALAVVLQYGPRPVRRRLSAALCKLMED